MPKVLVIQSHRLPLPFPWMQRCIDSVRAWAEARGFEHRFVDDAIFAPVPDWLLEKAAGRRVVASDYARLLALREALAEGYEAALWCDADFLVFAPDRLELPSDGYALGREIWIQRDRGKAPRANVKVHNAFMLFRRGNPFLDFYLHAAERMLRAHHGPMVPQLIGPKFLTAIHNIVQFPVAESAGVLSPAVGSDLCGGGGPSLELFRRTVRTNPGGVNLCASLAGTAGVDDEAFSLLIDLLLAQPDVLGK